MSRHGSRRPSINTSAEAVLRRLDHELDVEPSGVRDLARARLRPLALGAIAAGGGLVAAALLAPMTVAVLGGLIAAIGVVMATVVEDEDRVTGLGRTRRWCRRGMRRMPGRRGSSVRRPSAPIGCRVAPWLFPDPRKSRRP